MQLALSGIAAFAFIFTTGFAAHVLRAPRVKQWTKEDLDMLERNGTPVRTDADWMLDN